MSAAKIQVLGVENRKGRSKTGNDYDITICGCFCTMVDAEGVEHSGVGELILPKNHPPVSVGMYEGEFGISISQDKKITGRLVRLVPISSAVKIPASPVRNVTV